jgi:hypothetical protein
LPQGQPLSAEAFGKGLCVFWLSEAEHHEVSVIAAQGVLRVRRYDTGTQKITSLFLRPRTFSAGTAIRWLIALLVLCCDPLAIALTATASARRNKAMAK